MANAAVTFRNSTAIAARAAEVTGADWTGGMNNASCMPAVGVATDNSDLQESLPNWTLEDQFEVARAPQVSQLIGGNGYVAAADYPSSGGVEGNGSDQSEFLIGVTNPVYPNSVGTVTVTGNPYLNDLGVGWVLA